ncbi:hypothetical protein [Haloarchaeobius sp. HME9146]|uniref:hypothetical protein n=1 Tax=Haloarchaeobius sp. HME9146 TaxID=2978732 RepID=UPI0021BFBA8D|nr:hypothetical protein [Haloarchaeobius sp. HME9146]MCT9096477.1 hypothetical protein [Haloarchaeobius sp. HME9146]
MPTRNPGVTDDPARDGRPDGLWNLDRRDLLRTVPATALAGLAGCASIEQFVGDGDTDDATTTTTYGYGGTSTPAGTAASTTATAVVTATSTAEGDFGAQGYGQYGYGGTR